MSNTVYTRKARSVPNAPDEAEEYDDQGEYVEEAPQGSLLSNPGRVAALGGALLMLLLVFASMAWLAMQPTSTQQPGSPLQVGTQRGMLAPDFTLVNVRDNTYTQLSSLRGKPVFMNFWGTWCPPCRAEMPEMERFYQTYKNEIEVVGVSMAPRDDTVAVAGFIKLNSYSWMFVHDSDTSVAGTYVVNAVPTSYFIDKNGVIQAVHLGPMPLSQMETYLAQIKASQAEGSVSSGR